MLLRTPKHANISTKGNLKDGKSGTFSLSASPVECLSAPSCLCDEDAAGDPSIGPTHLATGHRQCNRWKKPGADMQEAHPQGF